jgi:hypothetical protein
MDGTILISVVLGAGTARLKDAIENNRDRWYN